MARPWSAYLGPLFFLEFLVAVKEKNVIFAQLVLLFFLLLFAFTLLGCPDLQEIRILVCLTAIRDFVVYHLPVHVNVLAVPSRYWTGSVSKARERLV